MMFMGQGEGSNFGLILYLPKIDNQEQLYTPKYKKPMNSGRLSGRLKTVFLRMN